MIILRTYLVLTIHVYDKTITRSRYLSNFTTYNTIQRRQTITFTYCPALIHMLMWCEWAINSTWLGDFQGRKQTDHLPIAPAPKVSSLNWSMSSSSSSGASSSSSSVQSSSGDWKETRDHDMASGNREVRDLHTDRGTCLENRFYTRTGLHPNRFTPEPAR